MLFAFHEPGHPDLACPFAPEKQAVEAGQVKDYDVGFIYSSTVLGVFNLRVIVCAIQPWWLAKHAVIDQDEHCRIQPPRNLLPGVSALLPVRGGIERGGIAWKIILLHIDCRLMFPLNRVSTSSIGNLSRAIVNDCKTSGFGVICCIGLLLLFGYPLKRNRKHWRREHHEQEHRKHRGHRPENWAVKMADVNAAKRLVRATLSHF